MKSATFDCSYVFKMLKRKHNFVKKRAGQNEGRDKKSQHISTKTNDRNEHNAMHCNAMKAMNKINVSVRRAKKEKNQRNVNQKNILAWKISDTRINHGKY